MGNDSSVDNKRICASLTSFSRSKSKVGNSYEADSVVTTVNHSNSLSSNLTPSSTSFKSAKDLDISVRPDPQIETLISAESENGSAALIAFLLAHSEDAVALQYGFNSLLRQLPHYNESISNNGSGGLSLSLPKNDPQSASSSTSLEGGVPLVISSMKRFPHIATLQEAACALLWVMSSRSEDEERIRQQRGVNAVVCAMKAFPTHAAIQRQGCGALYNLATRLTTRFEVGTVDEGIVVIFRALRYHVDDRDVCQHACAALMSLADDNRNKATMAEQDGIALLLSAMKKHIEDEVVCMHVCGALHNLCYQNGANKVCVKDHGGISLILKAMNFHLNRGDEISRGSSVAGADSSAHMQNNATLLLRACGVLWNLTCHNDTNKVLVAQSGGIECIVRAMRAFSHHSSIQREAAGALRNISAISQNKSLIARKDVVDTLLTCMIRHLSFAEIQEQACVVLYNICINLDVVELILKCNGLEAVHSALKAHPSDVSVQEEGFGCLCKFARTGLAQKKDIQNISIALANKALTAHSAHPGVRKYAQGLIDEWTNPHLLRNQPQPIAKIK